MRPKGITEEQLQAAAAHNKGLENMFDDDDSNGYVEYAKELDLEHLNYKS